MICACSHTPAGRRPSSSLLASGTGSVQTASCRRPSWPVEKDTILVSTLEQSLEEDPPVYIQGVCRPGVSP